MLSLFENKVAEFMRGRAEFGSSDKILLGVSGGADSTALLYVMSALKKEGVINGELMCAHINHQLRGEEADEDERFVIAMAEGLKLAVTTRRVDVRGFAGKKKMSIETAGRQLRLESLVEIAKENGCRWIATGHQKNDNAETILQRLARGTGFRGLCGIWPVRTFGEDVSFVRPLLCVGRDEIVNYLMGRGLQWREDRTNVDYSYRRNYIRHRLLPELERECGGSVIGLLNELAEAARKYYSLVCGRADEVWPELTDFDGDSGVSHLDELRLDLEVFGQEAKAVKVELIRRGLERVGCGEGELTQRHYERILELALRLRSGQAEEDVSPPQGGETSPLDSKAARPAARTGGKGIELPGRFVVWREYRRLIFAKAGKVLKAGKQIGRSARIKVPGRVSFGRYLIEASVLEARDCDIERFKAWKSEYVEWFDFEEVKEPLAVRFRREGDRFWPLGMGGEKKVGKFLTAAKVPYNMRRKMLVVADSEKIIWVCPVRISEQTKVTKQTQKILELQIKDVGAEE